MSMFNNFSKTMMGKKARHVIHMPACKTIGEPVAIRLGNGFCYNKECVVPAGAYTKEILDCPWVAKALFAKVTPTNNQQVTNNLVIEVVVPETTTIATQNNNVVVEVTNDGKPQQVLMFGKDKETTLTESIKQFKTCELRKTITREVVFSKSTYLAFVASELEAMKNDMMIAENEAVVNEMQTVEQVVEEVESNLDIEFVDNTDPEVSMVTMGRVIGEELKGFDMARLRKTVTRQVAFSKLAHMTCISDKLESIKRFLPDPTVAVVMPTEDGTSEDEWQ